MSRVDSLYVYADNSYSPVEPYRGDGFILRNLASKNAFENKEAPLPTAFFTEFDTDFELVYLWSGLVDAAAVRQRWPNPEDQDGGNDLNAWYASCTQIMHSINKLAPLSVNYDTVVAAAACHADQVPEQRPYILELRRARGHGPIAESLFLRDHQLQREDLFIFQQASFDAVLPPGRLRDTYIPLTLCHAVLCDLLGRVARAKQEAAIALSHRIPKLGHVYDVPWFRFINGLQPSAAVALAILEIYNDEDPREMLRCFAVLAKALPLPKRYSMYPDGLYTLRGIVTDHLPKPHNVLKRSLADVLCTSPKRVCIRSTQKTA